jgi:hypothetical protein
MLDANGNALVSYKELAAVVKAASRGEGGL